MRSTPVRFSNNNEGCASHLNTGRTDSEYVRRFFVLHRHTLSYFRSRDDYDRKILPKVSTHIPAKVMSESMCKWTLEFEQQEGQASC